MTVEGFGVVKYSSGDNSCISTLVLKGCKIPQIYFKTWIWLTIFVYGYTPKRVAKTSSEMQLLIGNWETSNISHQYHCQKPILWVQNTPNPALLHPALVSKKVSGKLLGALPWKSGTLFAVNLELTGLSQALLNSHEWIFSCIMRH